MTSVPQHSELEWPRLEPSIDDFIRSMAARGFAEPVEGNRDSNKIFTIPSAFSLPKSLGFNIANLKKIGRKAGTEANHKSAAASAWLLANAASHFEAAPMAWTGFGLC